MTKEVDSLGQVVTGAEADIQPDTKHCRYCDRDLPIESFQRNFGNTRANDCKECRRKKSIAGAKAAAERDTPPVTKEWVIQEAKKLYEKSKKDNDKIKLLDTIARNLSGDAKTATDDAKVIRDLIASKKKMKDMGR